MAGLFHPLLCSFCGFTALFPKGTVLLQFLHVCSKEVSLAGLWVLGCFVLVFVCLFVSVMPVKTPAFN